MNIKTVLQMIQKKMHKRDSNILADMIPIDSLTPSNQETIIEKLAIYYQVPLHVGWRQELRTLSESKKLSEPISKMLFKW